jgi:putative transposase
MAGDTLKLGRPNVAAIIDERYAREPDGWRRRRLLAVKLAAKGEYTSAEVAELCGISRSRLFVWLGRVREGGLEGLLLREKPGRKAGSCVGVKPEIITALAERLAANEFASVEQARRWLKKEHGIERPYNTVWNWLKKLHGVLRVPRPSHSKKNPDAAEKFKSELAGKLEALEIKAGSRVKVWFMDEARFGLHTELRRVWTLRGHRPVVTRQMKYAWDYLYGALGAVSGEAHFAHLPAVNLEWDRSYLENLTASDPGAIHVLIRDQAGFHLREGDPRLPERVRIVDLPPYSPELNPCEQMWDVVKDDTCNQVFETVHALRERMRTTLQRYWEDAKSVLRLIGRDWLLVQLNATPKSALSL